MYRKPILASTGNAIRIVKATLCLHKWLRRKELARHSSFRRYCSSSDIDSENRNGIIAQCLWRQDTASDHNLATISGATRLGSNFPSGTVTNNRNNYLEYFKSSAGPASWQNGVFSRGAH